MMRITAAKRARRAMVVRITARESPGSARGLRGGAKESRMAVEVQRRTIDVIPDAERHGRPRDQFTLWFGANMQITAIVDGALAVVFGADAL